MSSITQESIALLIPSLDPDEHLLSLIDTISQLMPAYLQQVVIVDDGSQTQTIFDQLAKRYSNLVILHHQNNRGKGAALKTGFEFILSQWPDITGIATMDGDGQHTASDLFACVSAFMAHPTSLILGERHFSKATPLRSRFGNALTNHLVQMLTQLPISDTQTGLRVIPSSYATSALQFNSQRYAFEFEMLLQAKKQAISIHTVPIHTIYFDHNAGSHFRVIRDSVAIYWGFIKFSLSGLVSFLFDIGIFSIMVYFLQAYNMHGIMAATITARLLSAVINYTINYRLVFLHAGRATLLKYFLLMCSQMIVSGLLTILVASNTATAHFETLWLTLIKTSVDFCLFVVSYQIQKRFIFITKRSY